MKQRKVLDRYEVRDDGSVIIDVAVRRIEELYSDFDRTSPYVRRDLDEHLEGYLIECAQEVGERKFVISIDLDEMPDDQRKDRVRGSISNHFLYLRALKQRELREKMRMSLVLLAIGLAIVCAVVWIRRALGQDRGVMGDVFVEGLTVAGWVSLWQALATFLIDWGPYRRQMRECGRLAGAPIQFRVFDGSVKAS